MKAKGESCSICDATLPDPKFARNYPNFVCRECDARAVNSQHQKPWTDCNHDDGENPIFIDGLKCWRRYRFGGYITMLDDQDCKDIFEFYEKHGAL